MTLLCYFCLFLLSLTIQAIVTNRKPWELMINSGEIRGEYLNIESEGYTVFKGIPYAAPPVGALRFQRPISPANWRGVMNATQYPPLCMQRLTEQDKMESYLKRRMSEDCLYLNVFCRPPTYNETVPVIVWIHGGGFQMGSSADYDQEPILNHFVSRNIVFVTFNYRLGPFGFLTTGDKLLPGNIGLWDMVLALQWIYNNIHAFRGDRYNVTLMGQGSGAAAASILALSPRASKLFHRVILMSGTAISPGTVRSVTVNATWNMRDKLCPNAENSTALLNCLATWSGKGIVKKLEEEILRVYYDDYQEWVPVIDGFGGIIPEAPEILASYRAKVPAIIGTTRDESALNLIILSKQGINMTELSRGDAEYLVRNLTTQYEGFTNHYLITQGCNFEYVHTRIDPGVTRDILKNGILKMYSHFWYNAPASNLASYYDRSHTPVYLYSFDHVSENLFAEHADWIGSFHGSDLIFLFGTEVSYLERRRDKNWQVDKKVTDLFADLITTFARTGIPTPEDGGFSFNWTRFSESELNFLSLTDDPHMEVGYNWRGHVYWNWYARHLDAVDVGNMRTIASLTIKLGDYQIATWILLCCALFFLAILIGLACYCTRKDAEEDDL